MAAILPMEPVRAEQGGGLLPLNRFTLAVWRRNFLTWRRLFWSSMASNVANPLLFLFAFGYGLGAVVKEAEGIPYFDFILPGMMAHAALFSASFETTISAYARFELQKTWDAILATPLRLGELLAGELLWAASKAMLASLCVLAVGIAWGGVPSLWGALMGLPVVFVASLAFAAYGLFATAHAKNWEVFSYFFTFWVTPMLMLGGTFFAVDRFPGWVEALAWAFPMTHFIAVLRPLTTGHWPDPLAAALHLLFIAATGALALWLAKRRLTRRLMT
ncbi:MAG: ABC transporter permease [Geminicoccaceae bacterium]|nr:ABC transporter permease [Geminicoccaceae bacterium]